MIRTRSKPLKNIYFAKTVAKALLIAGLLLTGVDRDCKHLYFFRPVSEGKMTITINYSNYHEDTHI